MIIFIVIIIIIIIFFLLLHRLSTFTNVIDNNNKYKYTAVIVEPREHKALKYVLNNFLENLNNDWCILIMHGNLNEEYVNNIINNDLSIYKSRIFTHNLKINNLTIDEYNKLLKSIKFYELILTEMFLVFQTDTIICSKFKDNINKFLEFDYVGAPWSGGVLNEKIGNGGLSLRRKSKMVEIINKCPNIMYPDAIDQSLNNEDVFFSFGCDKVSVYKPTYEEAKCFSIEQVYSNKSFGIHKAYVYLNKDNFNELKSYCPEIIQLVELNK